MLVHRFLSSCTLLLLLFGAIVRSSLVPSNSEPPNVWQHKSFFGDSLLGLSAVNHSEELTGFKQFVIELISKTGQLPFTSQVTQWLDQFKARFNKAIRMIERMALHICGLSRNTVGHKVSQSKQTSERNESCETFLTKVKQYLLKSTSKATKWLRKMFSPSLSVSSKEHIQPAVNRTKRSLLGGPLERSSGHASKSLKKNSNKVPHVHYRGNSLGRLRIGALQRLDTARRRLNSNRNNPRPVGNPPGNSNQRQTNVKTKKQTLRRCLTPQCLRAQKSDEGDGQLEAAAEAIRLQQEIRQDIAQNPIPNKYFKHSRKRPILNSVINDQVSVGGGGPGSKTLVKPRKRYRYQKMVNGEKKLFAFSGQVLADIPEIANY